MAFTQPELSNFSEAEYAAFREFLEFSCGIILGSNKNYLIDSRLRGLLMERSIGSLSTLMTLIERPGESALRQQVIDAMTTNETLWFRDKHPFDYFRDSLLPRLAKVSSNIRIWCAACSTGQEPYSLSICVDEFTRANFLNRINVEIVATDISSKVLAQAKSGVYDMLSLNRGMSPDRLHKYFKSVDANSWMLNEDIRQRVTFRPINLKDQVTGLPEFDVVFCRNVLIYFSNELQQRILTSVHKRMKPGAQLFLGGSETPKGLKDLFDIHYYSPGVVYSRK